MGCVSYVGSIITLVAWVTWIKIFFTWVNILRGHNFYVGQKILRGSLCGSKIFAWVSFLELVLKKIFIGTFIILSR